MGTASSSLQAQEGEHFSQIINPPKVKQGDPKPKIVNGIKIHPKALILKKISHDVLWEKFLASPAQSFALTFYEATAVLLEAAMANETLKKDKAGVEAEVKGYIDLVALLSEKDTSKCIDFMAVCSSVLLLSDLSIETKVDRLFELIVLKENPTEHPSSFEEFLVALSSFERGLTHAMGFPACSEAYVRTIATQWMALADPKHKGSADVTTTISSKNFFEFCTNRQHVVRKLLEAFGNSITINTTRSELVEVVDTVNNLIGPPAGGDEWMANPAWKKTAERMVPPALKASAAALNVKPSSTLTLEWIHGYRGFDCRNNIYCVNNSNTILYSAAAVGIALEYGENAAASKSQTHFSEHGDDIIAMTVVNKGGSGGGNLIASGEIGKTPAIYLYSYSKNSRGGGSFQSLSCMKGFHTKGVAQLAFNSEGSKLFSIGVDYTVAVYSTNSADKQFGKMVGSSQGPKDKILHCCYFGSPECDSQFISCGEKHVLVWKIDKGTLKQEQAKLTGGLKNKFFLCAVAVSANTALLSTNEGELLSLSNLSVMPVIFAPELAAGAVCGHGKNAINCMCVSADQRLLVTGGKDGKVIVWSIVNANATVTLRQVAAFDVTASTSVVTQSVRVVCQDLSGKATAPAAPAIRAVALSSDLRRIIVGTSTCEIIEFKLKAAGSTLLTYSAPATAPFDATALPLVAGHSKDEVWGLAVRPVTPENAASGIEYCTVGDDGYARFWSLASHSQIRCMNLYGMARAVAYSPDGVYLAIGFGGRVGTKNTKNKEDGLVKVYRRDGVNAEGVEQMTLCVELKDAKQWISVVRFSPDGSTLAVGSRDNSIYLYGVNQQFKKKAKFSKHNSGINQLDFTADSKYIQSTCSGYEILFSDAATGTQLTDGATKLLDVPMDSFTCTLGWPVIGIWSGAMDGSDVNSVDRSPSGALLATSDDFGKVNVFRYPAIKDGGNVHSIYNGHSSHVTGVRWVSLPTAAGKRGKTDDYLISIGGEDKCVFQWKNSGAEEAVTKGSAAAVSADEVEVEVDSEETGLDGPVGGDEFTAVKPWLGAIVKPTSWVTKDASKIHPFYAALGEFSTQHKRIQDEIMPMVKKDPSAVSADMLDVYGDVSRAGDMVLQKLYDSGLENDASPPDIDELELEWVHGYRGFDCRNNVYYVEPKNGTGRKVVYYAAALGIVLDPVKRTQKYFKGHSDDIMSMAINKTAAGEGDAIIATGQQGMGTTFVWEVPSMKTLASLSTKQKSVHMLAFSGDGRLIISIAEDKTIAVSDWKSSSVLVNTKGEAAVTHHLVVAPNTSSNLNFITCGDKYIRYWTLNGRNLTAGKVGTTGVGKIQQYLCVAELGGNYFMGCEDGSIYVIPADGKAVKAKFDQIEGGAAAAPAAAKGGKEGKEAKGPAVTAICTNNERNLLVTGSKDGLIVIWDGGSVFPVFLKDRARKIQFNVDSLGAEIMAKQIQSVSLLNSNAAGGELQLVIGTRGCDILEVCVNLSTGAASIKAEGRNKVLMRSHCNDELWGLATHPTRPEYCSTGDDKTLRFFNIHTRTMIASVPLGNISRTVCYNSEGNLLAVGFGGRVGKGKEGGGGVVRLYTANYDSNGQLKVTNVAERHDAKQWISDVKFSADNSTLAVAAHDCKIYIYSVTKDGDSYSLKLKNTFGKHNSVLNHIDLSSDGRYMQSNCSAYELLFCDTTNGKQITAATELRDVKWHTWTCTLGWPVQGIWAKGMDGSDINAVHRSHSGHLLATSDDFGKVNLFKYPCIAEGAQPLKYSGHSSHVMNVRFTVGDECLISCGGNDKCLMQWRHTIADVSSSGNHDAPSAGSSKKQHVAFEGGSDGASDAGGEAEVDFGGLGEPQGGDECGAIKPWLGAIRAPKNPPLISAAAPAAELQLSWVHGYTSGTAGANNSRISNNLFYNLEMNPVYPAAALGVQLARSPKGGAGAVQLQTYFKGHDDDILSLAISKDRRFIATGQTASKTSKGKGSIIVWDAIQSRILTRMDGCHARGVVSLAFNPDGNMLLSVGLDDNNTHILWSDMGGSWSRVQQVASEKSDKNPVLFSRWVHPSNPMCSSAEYHFLTGGGSGVNFWKLAGSQLSKKQGRFGRKYKQCPLLCSANLQGKEGWAMIVGTSTGDLYSYSEREVNNSVEKAHSGPVICLAEGGADCLFLVSGGKDRQVKVWNSQLQPMSSLDCTGYSFVDATIASIDIRPVPDVAASGSSKEGANDLVLLVGTHGGEILEVTAKSEGSSGGKSGSSKKASASASSAGGDHHEETRNLDVSNAEVEVLVYSHCTGELWGVATHPMNPDIAATVGDDSTLRVWSLKGRKMLKCVKLGWPARCVAWHPLGSLLAVGFMESVKGGYSKGSGGGKKGGKGKKGAAAAPAAAAAPKKSDAEAPEDTGTEGGEAEKDAGHKGAVHLYSFTQTSASAVEVVKRVEGCDSIAWMADIKFSPSGTTLCASSHDRKLYAYSIPALTNGDVNGIKWATSPEWKDCLSRPKYVFDKHSSAVLHFDFTCDGQYFQTNCQAGELLFGLLETGAHEKSATKVADYNGQLEDTKESENRLWASQTCILGWAVQGIWPNANNIQLSDINATDRHVSSKFLATADDYGLVKLFRYPCVTDGSKFNAYSGHSSHVTNCRWTIGNNLITTGGNDKCVFVWDLIEK